MIEFDNAIKSCFQSNFSERSFHTTPQKRTVFLIEFDL